jgi:hypothetical protein
MPLDTVMLSTSLSGVSMPPKIVQRLAGQVENEQGHLLVWVDTAWEPSDVDKARAENPNEVYRVVTVNDEAKPKWVH